MTPAKFAAIVRFYTGSNSTTFTDAEVLLLMNAFKDEFAQEIEKANEDYFGMRFYRNLEAGQREYAIPDEVLNGIKYVEAKLDGSEWEHLDEFDLNEYDRPTAEANIREDYASRKAAYDIFARALKIYSGDAIIDVTDGLVLYAFIYPEDFADLSLTTDMAVDPTEYKRGFPRQFHELLARRVAIAYKSSKDEPIPLSEKELKFDDDLAKAVGSVRRGNLDRSVAGQLPHDDGQDY